MTQLVRTIVRVCAMAAVAAFPVLAASPTATAAGAPTWDMRGNYNITFSCTSGCSGDYPHRAMITSQDNSTGDFSGTGFYVPDNSISWDITGNTMGNDLTFTIVYNNVNPGYTVNAVGTIDENGNFSGTATGPGQTFTFQNTSNHADEIVGNGMAPAECDGEYDTVIHGTNGRDRITGTPGNDLIFGYGGNDRIDGGAGDDCIVGGLGRDTLDGGAADDVVYGQGGNDTLKGDSGNDELYGGYGNDKLHGGAGDDIAVGGEGNDTLNGNSGYDSLTGEAGTDTANGGSGTDSCAAETEKSCEA